jgi:hypothetical protein
MWKAMHRLEMTRDKFGSPQPPWLRVQSLKVVMVINSPMGYIRHRISIAWYCSSLRARQLRDGAACNIACVMYSDV